MTFSRTAGALGGLVLSSLLMLGCGQEAPADGLAKAEQAIASSRRADAIVLLKSALQREPDLLEARWLLGRTLFELEDYGAAQVELRKLLNQAAYLERVTPLIAAAMLFAGEHDKVILEFGGVALEDAERQAELKASLAMANFAKGRLEPAKALSEEARKLAPSNAIVLTTHARLLGNTGQGLAALQAVEAVLVSHPKYVPALLLRAELLAHKPNAGVQAAEAFGEVLKIDARNVQARAGLLLVAARAKDWVAAQAQLKELQTQLPGHVLPRYLDALVDSLKGDYQKSYEKLQPILTVAASDARVSRLAGVVSYGLGKYLQATTHLGKAVNLGEADPQLAVMLARSQLAIGDPQGALASLRPHLRGAQPGKAVYMAAAEAQTHLGDMKAAAAHFQRVLQIDPRDAMARTALALSRSNRDSAELEASLLNVGGDDESGVPELALMAVRMNKRDFNGALAAVDALERKQPGRAGHQMLRGRIELARGDRAKARQYFEAAHARAGDYVPAVMALVDIDVREGQSQKAMERLQALAKAGASSAPVEMAMIKLKSANGASVQEQLGLWQALVTRFPNEAQPRLGLARVHMASQSLKEALTVLQEGASRFPEDPAFVDALARTFHLMGDLEQAQGATAKLVAMRPSSAEPLVRMGDIAFAKADLRGARSSYEKALALDPRDLKARQGLMQVYATGKQFAEARAQARAVQKGLPTQAIGWLMEGDVEHAAREPAAAVAAYRRAFSLSPASETAAKLHAALVASGAADESSRLATQWMADRPKDALFRLYMGQQFMEKRAWADAERIFLELHTLAPRDPSVLNNLAWTQLQLNKPDAMRHIELALKSAPGQPALLDTLAAIQAKTVGLEQALKTQQQAVEADPQDPLHRFHLAEYLVQLRRTDDARKELQRLAELGPRFQRQKDVQAMLAKL